MIEQSSIQIRAHDQPQAEPQPPATVQSKETFVLRAIFRIIAGVFLVVLGIIGLILPIMPGWIFLIPGLIILGDYFPPIKRLVDWAKSKFVDARNAYSKSNPPASPPSPPNL